MEDVLVETPAALKWRYRRELTAERAEIRIQERDTSKIDELKKQQWEEASELWATKNLGAAFWGGVIMLSFLDHALFLSRTSEVR
jgi:hypothetical protein